MILVSFFRAARFVYEERRHCVAQIMQTGEQMFAGRCARGTERRARLHGGH